MNTGLDVRKCLQAIHPLSSNPLEHDFFEAIIAHMKLTDFHLRRNKLGSSKKTNQRGRLLERGS